MVMALSNPATAAASPKIRSRCLSTATSPTLPLALSSKSAFCGQSLAITASRSGRQSRRAYSGVRASASEIPKQFRKEGLKEGLEENFRSVPQSLYGLNPTQMDMFMTEDNPFSRQARKVTETSISSHAHYTEGTGMWSMGGLEGAPSRLTMSASMYRGGGGMNRPKTAPPDLPSLLLDARICYIGMPIVPAVTELVIAELLWLDYDNPGKPIYLYINSPGTQNEKKESIGFETEAYAIADTMNYVKAKVFTVNCGQALGQAAMLLAIGNKGNRFVQPNAVTKLYSPKVNQSGGSATEMWLKAKELDVNTEYYAELLARGTGKTVEEIKRDIARPRYFRGQEAVDYGLCDGIIQSRGVQMDRKNYDQMLAESKATRAKYARPQAQGAGAAR